MRNLVEELKNRMPLCIWGEWLGTGGFIGANYYLLINHEITSDGTIILHFDENEKCTIIKPVGVVWKGKYPYIKSAEKVIREAYYYGKPQTQDTLATIEYTLLDNSKVHVVGKSNYGSRDEFISVKGKVAITSF